MPPHKQPPRFDLLCAASFGRRLYESRMVIEALKQVGLSREANLLWEPVKLFCAGLPARVVDRYLVPMFRDVYIDAVEYNDYPAIRTILECLLKTNSRNLDMSWVCGVVSELVKESLVKLVPTMRDLRVVILNGSVTDELLRLLCCCCEHLEELDASGDRISKDGLELFGKTIPGVHGCRNLVCLHLTGSKFLDSHVARLLQQLVNLEELAYDEMTAVFMQLYDSHQRLLSNAARDAADHPFPQFRIKGLSIELDLSAGPSVRNRIPDQMDECAFAEVTMFSPLDFPTYETLPPAWQLPHGSNHLEPMPARSVVYQRGLPPRGQNRPRHPLQGFFSRPSFPQDPYMNAINPEDLLDFVTRSCPLMESFKLDTFSQAHLIKLQRFLHLRMLSLSVPEVSLGGGFASCMNSNLTSLELRTSDLPPDVLVAIETTCESLAELKISLTGSSRLQGWYQTPAKDVFRNLEVLHYRTEGSTTVSKEEWLYLTSGAKNLVDLRIRSRVEFMTDLFWTNFLTNVNQLERLEIMEVSSGNADHLFSMGETFVEACLLNCPTLRDVSGSFDHELLSDDEIGKIREEMESKNFVFALKRL